MHNFPVTAVHACVCREVEQAGRVAFQTQLCMQVRAMMRWGLGRVRDFPVTAVHACVYDDGEQAGCVTLQSQSCMHLCTMMGSRQCA